MINPVGTCHICKRRHDNIGFQLSRSHPTKWYCRECSGFIGYMMPKKQFDIYETESLRAGGVIACQYLDAIGKTDMAELTEEQWLLFFTKFSGGYEDSMRKVFEGMADGIS